MTTCSSSSFTVRPKYLSSIMPSSQNAKALYGFSVILFQGHARIVCLNISASSSTSTFQVVSLQSNSNSDSREAETSPLLLSSKRSKTTLNCFTSAWTGTNMYKPCTNYILYRYIDTCIKRISKQKSEQHFQGAYNTEPLSGFQLQHEVDLTKAQEDQVCQVWQIRSDEAKPSLLSRRQTHRSPEPHPASLVCLSLIKQKCQGLKAFP